MPNLSILNTLIAMVIVILVLSLIVQSIQTLVKKLFKLKSRTILNSLEDLFLTITQNPDGTADAAAAGKAKQLVGDVTQKLREMGRETLRGKPMLDSLAKGDLLKVLTRVEAENLLPGAVSKFQSVLTTIAALNKELDSIDTSLLEGDASAKFATLQASLLPIVDDIEALARGGKVNEKILLGDLYRLRQFKAADVLAVLGSVQQRVGQDLAAARAAGAPAAEIKAVEDVSDGLKNVAKQIAALGKAFDAALVPLRERVQQAEVWYDTVMQGFEERYARHMRTVALGISVFVVVFLNANFFSIYRAIAADPIKTEELTKRAPDMLKLTDAPPASASTAPDTSGTNAPPPTTIADLRKQGQQVDNLVGTYKSFGIQPLTLEQFVNGVTFKTPARDVFETVVGWIIMVMLLSAGAPFWQDTLESLFGLKNLLRDKSNTKNIEGEKGGQPKP